MGNDRGSRVLVTGAAGFVGRALVPVLLSRGYRVRACTRGMLPQGRIPEGLDWARADLLQPGTLGPALEGVKCAFYLVHSIGQRGGVDYAERDRLAAKAFSESAEKAGVERIVYLGGVAPTRNPSRHLQSRLEVGGLLRGSRVRTLELRAAMIVGPGGASWRIVRDLALRLPAMVLPRWLDTRSCPVALEDVVRALADAVEFPLAASDWFDLPGPEALTGKEILERIVRLEGRRMVYVSVPVLTPKISALWLKLVTHADFALAKELVLGLTEDLLPRDERYWEETKHPPRIPFLEGAQRALTRSEGGSEGPGGWALEESIVALLGARAGRGAAR
jgi:uncharacterized protein YbjT (DUF2867 family)